MPVPRVLSVAALVTPLLAPSAGLVGGEASPPDGAGPSRPVVLMLHGRGMQGRDTASLRHAWSGSLDEGITAVAGRSPLRPDDLRLVWYADALESGSATCTDEGRPRRRAEGWARDVGTTLEAAGTLMAFAARWMSGPERVALDALASDLLYLGDDGRRCGAGERLAEALATALDQGRPVVLVAHSFGALVAYDHLRSRSASDTSRVERWVTVGSLLGHPELRELLFADGREGGLPAGVGSWVNVYDPRDPLAAPLSGVGGAPTGSGAIEDRVTERAVAGDPHLAARYLADPATASAVLEAWCAAAGLGPGADPPACRADTRRQP